MGTSASLAAVNGRSSRRFTWPWLRPIVEWFFCYPPLVLETAGLLLIVLAVDCAREDRPLRLDAQPASDLAAIARGMARRAGFPPFCVAVEQGGAGRIGRPLSPARFSGVCLRSFDRHLSGALLGRGVLVAG